MNRIKAMIPNAITMLNLVFGMVSILASWRGDLEWASWCVLLALVADGCDGRSARWLGVSSELGKELDSLCDLVSFGVASAVLAYVYCLRAFGCLGDAVAVLFAVCVAWRLARFNVNTGTVHGYFCGLASPTGGCLIATSTLFTLGCGIDINALGCAYPLAVAAVALLMVSNVHYPDFKGGGERVSAISWAMAAALLAAIACLGLVTAPLATLLFGLFSAYTLLGVANSLLGRR